jgi:hypothetical protein
MYQQKFEVDPSCFGPNGSFGHMFASIWASLWDGRTQDAVEASPYPASNWSGQGLKPFLRKWSFEIREWRDKNASFIIAGRTLTEWSQKFHDSGLDGPLSKPLVNREPAYHLVSMESFAEALVFATILRDRRIMTTFENGYIGIANPQAEKGDKLCILLGSTFPVILRECEDGYIVVGEAYVHGIMNGELMKTLDLEKDMTCFCPL